MINKLMKDLCARPFENLVYKIQPKSRYVEQYIVVVDEDNPMKVRTETVLIPKISGVVLSTSDGKMGVPVYDRNVAKVIVEKLLLAFEIPLEEVEQELKGEGG